jgi:protein phosphatase
MHLRAAALSDIGRVRVRNEDRCLIDERLGVFGVADGVGGLPGGAEASQTAHDWVLRGFREGRATDAAAIRQVIEEAGRAVADVGRAISPTTGIATTLTLGAFRGARFILAHIGDSRCYVQADGVLRQLTQDHLAGHALSRCLGHPVITQVDIAELVVQPAARYLFCTDGLTHCVADDEIGAIIRLGEPPESILRQLVARALRHGGYDNVSVVLVDAET